MTKWHVIIRGIEVDKMKSNISMQYSKMIRSMADELNNACHEQDKFKTVTVHRKTLIQLIEFIAIEKDMKATDVAEEVDIAKRTWRQIKGEPSTQVSIRKQTILGLVNYVYTFAENVEQLSFVTV